VSHAIAAAASAAAPMSPRTRLLLEGPVAGTLLRLAAPNVLVMVLQATVSTLDAVFVGWLGSEALAGVSIVFPLVMLMQTMSGGGMGAGVASAVARALGGGRRADADALVVHAIVIALVMGGAFTFTLELAGPNPARLAKTLEYPSRKEFIEDYRRRTTWVRALYDRVVPK